jgi:hypothetical protein
MSAFGRVKRIFTERCYKSGLFCNRFVDAQLPVTPNCTRLAMRGLRRSPRSFRRNGPSTVSFCKEGTSCVGHNFLNA